MTSTRNRIAVVTGAGSGIGRALALELASRGCRLALGDVGVEGLGETVQACEQHGADVYAQRLDVTDRAAFAAFAAAVEDRFGPAELVCNNAGVALFAWAHEQSFADIDRVLDVNLHGVINGSQLFLEQLRASGGHLVNISSLFGIVTVPGQSAYHASKFGVRGYTEALAVEARAEGNAWRASVVHPGGIDTNIAKAAHYAASADREALVGLFEWAARTSPVTAAQVILRGVERNRTRIHIGADAKLVHALVRLGGIGYQRVVARAARRLSDVQPDRSTSSDSPAAAANPTATPSQRSRTA